MDRAVQAAVAGEAYAGSLEPHAVDGFSEALDLQSEAHGFEDQLKAPAMLDQDTIEMGVDLIDRTERLVTPGCGAPTTLDQALLLIGRQHGGATR